MCGRYSFTKNSKQTESRFQVKVSNDWKARYNIAPTQDAPVITNRKPDEVSMFRFGLIPNWSLNEATGKNLINARAETVLNKSPFKQNIYSQRCLILSDGYYEWKSEGKKKQPYRFTLATDEAFALAGVWDSWDNGDDVINSFTIITTEANSLVSPIHNRMPAILDRDLEKEWLRENLSDYDITELLRPYDPDKMACYQTHRAVNSVSTDSPECIQVAPKLYPGETYFLFE